MARNGNLSGPIARVTDSVGRLFRLPAFVERRRMLVVPAPTKRSARRRRRVTWPRFVLAPLVLLVPAATSVEDYVPLDAAGEVDLRPAVRRAAERFVDWEARAFAAPSSAPVERAEVAEGIRLLADAVAEGGTGAPTSDATQALAAMQWHGEQLAVRPGDLVDGAYEDAGHAHAAFMHAARLLGALPDVPGGVVGELTRSAVALNARPLGAQGPEVRRFFHRAATVLAATAAR